MNFGYWTPDTAHFTNACENLASLLANETEMSAGHSVLDCGFGCGDSILFWFNRFTVQKVTGISLAGLQFTHALNLCEPFADKIHLIQGDVLNHIVDLPANHYDSVVAVDCAYHFNNKSVFLGEVFRVLSDGKRFALSDFCLPVKRTQSPWYIRLLQKLICRLANIPIKEIVTQEEYRQQLTLAGFTEIHVQNITHNSFTGYAQFIKKYAKNTRNEIHPHKLKKFKLVGAMLGFIARKNIFNYCIVCARKPAKSDI